jgi:excisionase family DNA binding protein
MSPLPPNRKCYRPEEFAELTGYGLSTLFKRIREGKLRAYRDGPSITLIRHEDGEAFLDSLKPITPDRPSQ